MCSREGYNLFTKYGRHAFWRDLTKYKTFNHYVWQDTICPIICKIIGHKQYLTDDDEKACKRCSQYL